MSGNNVSRYAEVSALNDVLRHEDVRGSRSIAPRILNPGMVKDGSEWSRSRPGRSSVGETILVHLINWVIIHHSRSSGNGDDTDL